MRRPPTRYDGTGQVLCPGPPWCRRLHVRGERHGRAKLTDRQVGELRYLADGRTRQVDLARRFGVSQATVSVLVRYLRRNLA